MRWFLILTWALAGCDSVQVRAKDLETGLVYDTADADTDADSDADTDADSDADSDADTDTDTGIDAATFCAESLSTTAPAGPDCYTSTLSCGDVIDATTEGGGSDFVGDDWESWYCTPNLDRYGYDGPERVYTMFIPAETTATFQFDSPCEDLDLFVLYWSDEDTCPTSANSTPECEAADGEGDTDSVSVWSDVGAQYLVMVDGRDGSAGNFRVSVTCQE